MATSLSTTGLRRIRAASRSSSPPAIRPEPPPGPQCRTSPSSTTSCGTPPPASNSWAGTTSTPASNSNVSLSRTISFSTSASSPIRCMASTRVCSSTSARDHRLAATSPYKNAATDGKDPGADIDALTAATASALSGGGTGGGPAPSPVSVSPSNVAFGLVTVGTTSPAADIQAFNPSAAGVTLSSVAITGPFVITQNHCLATNTWNGVIPPGTHCDMFVVFAPAVGGAATGRLNISVAGSVYPVMLSGTGAAAADTTPPSIPSGLTATVISSSRITLAWSPSTDNVAVSGYNVFRNGTLIGIVGR